MKSMGPLPAWAFVSILLSLAAPDAGETRLWSFPTGITLEAELVKSDLASATLVDKAGKEHVYKIGDIGIGDREFMVEQAGADQKILSSGAMAVPEKQMPSPVKSFETLDDQKATFGEVSLPLLRTEHFLIASDDEVMPVALAETAERLWNGVAVQHPEFHRHWGSKRVMIVIVGDRKVHSSIGKWFFKRLKGEGKSDEAGRKAQLWDVPWPQSRDGFRISADEAARYQVKEEVFYYICPYATPYKTAMSPLLVHLLSERLLKEMTGVTDGPWAYAFFTGYAFRKEIQLAGKATTTVVEGGGSDTSGAIPGIGFTGDWPTALRGLVRKGTVKPDLTSLMTAGPDQATRENLALMESWIAFMQSTNPRLVRFDHLVRRIAADHKIPAAEEIAKIYGCDSVAAFNESWTQFILDRGRK